MVSKMTALSFLSNTVTKPFNQHFKECRCEHFEINNIAQVLSGRVDSDYLILLLDINYFSFDGFLSNKSNEKFDELEVLLKSFRENNSTKVIVSNVVNNYLDINTTLNIEDHQRLLDLNSKINRLSEISDVAILNIYDLVFLHGYQNFINLKNGFLFQAPWTKLAYSTMAISIDESIQLFQFSRKKVLILDADNTLWGGIVGEDGIDNIDIDENYPGKLFRYFQQQLKFLQGSGLLLAIVSKNNLNDVRDVFENKNMPLKWDDFIIKKINWNPKSQNIQEVVNELNVGLDSVIFLDDSSFEISEVENAIDIDTIQISTENPIDNLKIFDHLVSVKTLNITKEDKEKSYQYQAQEKRREDRESFQSIGDYLSSIDMVVNMSINDKNKVKRIAQLVNKTNQFNLTTKRYSESEIIGFMENHSVFGFELFDKFGDFGLVAVVIIVNNDIDSFLVSCRALGRRLEYKVLYLITKYMKNNLKASYTKTEKNSQVSNFYDKFSTSIDHDNDTVHYRLNRDSVRNVDYIKERK